MTATAIDTTGFLYGIGIALFVLLMTAMFGAGFLIFRRVTGL